MALAELLVSGGLVSKMDVAETARTSSRCQHRGEGGEGSVLRGSSDRVGDSEINCIDRGCMRGNRKNRGNNCSRKMGRSGGNVDWSGSYMDWSRSNVYWCWGDMNWCRGYVDWRLRDVNAMNVRSTTTT